ncbi:MAG: hypothetical protein IT580_22345 [Verrucomicrobiales bacterium]|nr:hypothetical protein [Verrucomicrobiales bacterium]
MSQEIRSEGEGVHEGASATTLRDFARWLAAGVVVVGTGMAARVGSGRLCFKASGCPDCPAFGGCERPKANAWRSAHEKEAS